MTKRNLIIVLVLLLSCQLFADDGKDMPCFDKLWKNKSTVAKDATGKTWRETGVINMTFRSSITHVESILSQKSFQRKNKTEQEKNGKKCYISLWTNTGKNIQVIIMFLEKDVDETSFSWGEVQHGK